MRIQPHPAIRMVLGVFALSTAAVYSYIAHAAIDEPPIPRGVEMASWHDNGRDGRYLLQVAQGPALAKSKRVTGTVKTDTDCDLDGQGLSHCHNVIELTNGTRITVIDTHNMHRYRCLEPGERITLTGIGAPWVMGTLSGK